MLRAPTTAPLTTLAALLTLSLLPAFVLVPPAGHRAALPLALAALFATATACLRKMRAIGMHRLLAAAAVIAATMSFNYLITSPALPYLTTDPARWILATCVGAPAAGSIVLNVTARPDDEPARSPLSEHPAFTTVPAPLAR